MESWRSAFAILIERSHKSIDGIQQPNPKFRQDKSTCKRITAAARARDIQARLTRWLKWIASRIFVGPNRQALSCWRREIDIPPPGVSRHVDDPDRHVRVCTVYRRGP